MATCDQFAWCPLALFSTNMSEGADGERRWARHLPNTRIVMSKFRRAAPWVPLQPLGRSAVDILPRKNRCHWDGSSCLDSSSYGAEGSDPGKKKSKRPHLSSQLSKIVCVSSGLGSLHRCYFGLGAAITLHHFSRSARTATRARLCTHACMHA